MVFPSSFQEYEYGCPPPEGEDVTDLEPEHAVPLIVKALQFNGFPAITSAVVVAVQPELLAVKV